MAAMSTTTQEQTMTTPANPHSWSNAVEDAQRAASEAFQYAYDNALPISDGAEWDAAYEWADGSAWHIYSGRVRSLWADNLHIQEGEYSPIYQELLANDADIDTRIRLCVYIAIAKVFADKWTEHADLERAA
jgi:hypothetical protein